jgi:hypothetical protein
MRLNDGPSASLASFVLSIFFAMELNLVPWTPAAAQSSDQSVIYLNQAWSQDDREWYYHFSQGSAVLSYDIFLNLEVAGSQELFRSDANLSHYGLIPEGHNWMNPDGLPIGISKTTVATPIKGWPAGDYIGPTCAACHEGQLDYKGKHVRIEGGTNHAFDFQALTQALDSALQATLTDTTKFDRLAVRLKAESEDAKGKLRKRLASEATRVHEYATRTAVSPHPYGPGRIDAFSLIFDRVTATLTVLPENWSTPFAPVKPPFLWNAPQGDWTQWGGTIQDPIGRNLGETMGVFFADRSELQISSRWALSVGRSYPRAHARRGTVGAFGAAQLAGECVWQDRSCQSESGRGAFCKVLRKLSQRVALSMDHVEQIRKAIHCGGARPGNLRRYRSGAT